MSSLRNFGARRRGTAKREMRRGVATILAVLVCGMLALSAPARAASQSADIKDAINAFETGDYNVALAVLRPLAKANAGEADYWLGRMYERGLGVPKDSAKAIDYYRKAAWAGWRDAEFRLGKIYFHGTETLQNFTKAHMWLERAALDGNAVAARYVGKLYAKGWGVKKDPVWAYVWYEIAAKQGDYKAPQLRDALLKTMSGNQIAKAQSLTRETAPEVFGLAENDSDQISG